MLSALRDRSARRPRSTIQHDRSGSALIEFALLAPILITLLFGIADLAPTTMARFKIGDATQSVADLTSQFSVAQTSDMVGLFAAGTDVIAPFSSTNLIFRITNVASDGNGNAFVYWSCAQSPLTPRTVKGTITATPDGTPVGNLIWTGNNLLNGNGTNTSFVMVESSYTYTAPAQFILKSPLVWTTTAYTLPRLSSFVGFPWDGNQNHAPPLPTSVTKTTTVSLGNNITCSYAS